MTLTSLWLTRLTQVKEKALPSVVSAKVYLDHYVRGQEAVRKRKLQDDKDSLAVLLEKTNERIKSASDAAFKHPEEPLGWVTVQFDRTMWTDYVSTVFKTTLQKEGWAIEVDSSKTPWVLLKLTPSVTATTKA